ncbi:MAG: MMPL family transporter [Thermoplasmata archaeon]|nr:MAG: MMPL family transporter [Thermoplasmata archaeon]
MQFKRCPKCGKEFDESWQLCDDCGIKLVVPGAALGLSPFIGRMKDKLHSIDMALDSRMSKAVDTAEDAKESLEGLKKQATEKATVLSEKAGVKAQQIERKSMDLTRRMRMASSTESVMDFIIDKPKIVILVVLTLTLVIGAAGIPAMLENISGDMTIYLPQDDQAAIILNEVNEDWSTEMIVIFVETPNSIDRTYGNEYNITSLNVLNEISAIEEGLDPQKDDSGVEDDITFALSISTLIKEINAAPQQVARAMGDELELHGVPYEQIPGGYEIPQDQDEIDTIVSQIPDDSRKGLVIDTNNDGIWDSAGVIIGVYKDADQEEVMKFLYTMIDKHFVDTKAEKGDFNHVDKWWERVDDGEVHCRMTPTGPVPMTQALTGRTYDEFSVVLPSALFLICGVLFFLHRTPKIIIVSAVPILCSLVMTLGIMGLTGWVLSPQVVLVAPILLALGVAYGLYIANRYSYERANITDKKERMKVAIRTTGKAIFLSALTTAVGFSSLMFVNMVPMRVLGFGLTTGILICWAITMLTVPALVMILDYEKKGQTRSAEKLGQVPVRHRKKIFLAALTLTIISISLIPSIEANMNLTEMSPQDEPTVRAMNKYSEEFGGGQMGMVLVRGVPVDESDSFKGQGSMKDIEVLDDIEDLENQIKAIEEPPINPPLSVVDVMKMIKIPESAVPSAVSLLPQQVQDRINETVANSFWDVIHMANDDTTSIWYMRYGRTMQDSIINIFYNSISPEMRGFLVNKDYSKTLVYIDIPSMDAVETEKAVNAVNRVVRNYPAGSSTSPLTGFAALVVAVNNLLMFNSIFSLFMALIIVFFVLIAIFRSLRLAALTMIPVSMVVAWEPLTLVLTGIDLNLVTAMIGSIIVGIGIDFGIHMTERVREAGESFQGIRKSVETSGFTFLEATFTIVAGLLSVLLINIRSIQEFILMVIFLLVFSMVAAMFILPAIYAMLSPEKEETMMYRGEIVEVEPELGSE